MARRSLLLGIGALAALACNQLLGIGEAELDPALARDGGGGAPLGMDGATALTPMERDPCTTQGTLVCGRDLAGEDQSVLYCDQARLTKVFRCPGIQSCIDGESGAFVACGTADVNLPFAKTGAPCAADQTGACSFDQTTLLECVSGTWVESRHCAPSHCANVLTSSGTRSLACENGGYAPGDRCAFSGGKVVCSVDLTSVLSCTAGTTTVFQACPSGEQCTDVGNGSLGCR